MKLKNRIIQKLKAILSLGQANSPLRNGPNGSYIFIHINKTGGTSIAKAIGLPEKKHLTAEQVITQIGERAFNDAFVFAVVRNPWSKVVSHYKYRVKTNQTAMKTNPIDFNEWVKCTYGPEKNLFYYDQPTRFQPQLSWLKNSSGELVVPHIIRFEKLSEEFKPIALKLGLQTELPHLNATKKESYTTYYNPESQQIIANWFKEDIAYFNYVFGEA
jgi:hypothetical protein